MRTRWELEACLEQVDASPLGRQRGVHRWVMAEVPSVAYWIPEYAKLGIDEVSIGSMSRPLPDKNTVRTVITPAVRAPPIHNS